MAGSGVGSAVGSGEWSGEWSGRRHGWKGGISLVPDNDVDEDGGNLAHL